MVEISVGKERHTLVKKRYFIRIGNVTTYYYTEFDFWNNFFKVVNYHEISALDIITLAYSIK